MKTKFTKGKWVKYRPTDAHRVTHIVDSENVEICKMNHYLNEQSEANALLISKAPEMFEMLKELLMDIDEIEYPTSMNNTIVRAKQLLKEATEI